MHVDSISSSMLKSDQRRVKEATIDGPVLVTDGDDRRFLFGGAASLKDKINDILCDYLYDQRIVEAARRGEASIARGDYISGTADECIAEMERIRLANA